MENREQEIRQDREDLIEGRNAVAEAIRAGRTIDKIFVARGDTDRTLARILAKARENGIVVTECDRRKLDSLSATGAHQGIIAQAAMREYASIEDILERAAERGEDPFIVVCDEIADPHNLGAILRTAECAGVHGVIIPKRRAAGLTAVTDLHRETVRRVNAPAQARAAEAILPLLTEAEHAVYKRGRNAKVNSVPQHADVAQYHAATGLETLFGWLYLLGRTQRLRELFAVITEVL